MRKRSELIALVLLVVIIVAGVALSQRHEQDRMQLSKERVIRSSYRSFPEGSKALYLTLELLRYPVTRQIRPLSMLPAEGFLIISDPYKKPSLELEGQKLVAWAARGNYALIAVEHHQEFIQGLGGAFATADAPDADHAPGASAPVEHDMPVKEATARRMGNSPLTATAPALQVRSSFRLPRQGFLPPALRKLVGGDPVPLYADDQGVVAALSKIGDGGIVWCSSPWSFSNAGVGREKNLDFVLALADQRPKGSSVIFDEYHHGFGADMTVVDLAPPLTRLGMVELALALLLLGLLFSWRFGPARLPAEERFTRSRAEYLTSMAMLLQRAHATTLVRDRLDALLRREVGRRLGLPPQTTLETVRVANAQRPAVDQAALDKIVMQLTHLHAQPRPDQEALFRLAGEVHRLLHRRTSVPATRP